MALLNVCSIGKLPSEVVRLFRTPGPVCVARPAWACIRQSKQLRFDHLSQKLQGLTGFASLPRM
jgi:hypothetical protein